MSAVRSLDVKAGVAAGWLAPVGALLAVALILILPGFVFGASALDSGPYNYAWTRQFADALGRGEIYPRWLPDSFRGLGSPTFFFYPPLAFYVSGLVALIGVPVWQAINVAAAGFAWASGVSMWLWLRDRSARPLLWAVVYMAAPYHLADYYLRAALAEYAAYAWLPLIAMGLDRRPRLLAVAFAGLICTHLPTAVLCGVFLVAPSVAAKLVRREPIAEDLAAGLAALALAAVYLLPALTLQRYVAIGELWSADFRPSSRSLWFGTLPQAHLATAAAVVVAAVTAWVARPAPRQVFWPALTAVTALIAAGVVPWIWALPVIEKVQFPYRLLSIAEFAAITALAPCVLPWRRARWVVAFAAAAWSVNVALAARSLAGGSPELRARIEREMPDGPEYLPAGAAPPHLSRRSRDPAVERFLPADRFNFPIWRVIEGGRAQPAVGPTIPAGVQVERRILPQETIGAVISGLGLLATLAWSLLARRRRV